MDKKLGLWDNLLIALITLGMVGLFVVLPLSLSIFNTSQSLKEQYSLLDAFYAMRNRLPEEKPYYRTQTDITIVDLAEVPDRADVYRVMEKVMALNPRLVGFDIWLGAPKNIPEDSLFKAMLLQDPRIISPCQLEKEKAPGSTHFLSVQYPFYASKDAPVCAAVNLEIFESNWICKTFTPVLFHDGKPYETMAVTMSHLLDTVAYSMLMKQPVDPHYIQFSRSGYEDLSGRLLLESEQNWFKSMIEGKVVLIGDKSDPSDFFPTPPSMQTSGVEVHTAILATILSRSWPRVMHAAGAWLLALLGVWLTLPLLRKAKRNEWLVIFTPVLQALLILLYVFACYWVFSRFNYYIDSIYLLIATGFMEVAEALYVKIKSLIVK